MLIILLFLLYFDQIIAALVSKRDFFQKQTNKNKIIVILFDQFNSLLCLWCWSQLPGRKQTASSGLEASGVGSGSLESAQNFLQDSLIRVSALQNLETPGAQDLLEFTIRFEPLMHCSYIILRSFNTMFVKMILICHKQRSAAVGGAADGVGRICGFLCHIPALPTAAYQGEYKYNTLLVLH